MKWKINCKPMSIIGRGSTVWRKCAAVANVILCFMIEIFLPTVKFVSAKDEKMKKIQKVWLVRLRVSIMCQGKFLWTDYYTVCIKFIVAFGIKNNGKQQFLYQVPEQCFHGFFQG